MNYIHTSRKKIKFKYYKSLYLWIQVASFGLFIPLAQIISSLAGFLFSLVWDSIDNILKVICDILNDGDQSLSKIFRQINPLEKTYGFIGILSIKVTVGLSKGYKNILKSKY